MSNSEVIPVDYNDLVSRMPAMVHSIDRAGLMIAVSDTWLMEMGYSREEVLGRLSTDFLTEGSRQFAQELIIPKFWREGEVDQIGYQFETKDGRVLDILLSATAVRDETGEAVRSIAVLENMTQTLAAQRRLRFQAGAIAASLDGIALCSRDGRLIFANEAVAEMYGFSGPMEMPGLHWAKLYYEEEARRLKREALSVFERAGRWRGEAVGRRLDGSTFAQEISLSLSMGNTVVAVVRDISDRKRRVEALREAEEKYRSIFENASEGIFQTSVGGRYLSANVAMAEILGYGSPEQLMSEVTDVAAQIYANPRRRNELLEELETRGEVKRFEIEVRRRDGARRWLELNARVVRDPDGHVIYYEGTAIDISQRRRAEVALRESIQFSQQVIANAGEGIIVYDRDRRIVIWNPMMEHLTGLPADRVLGRDVEKVRGIFKRTGVTDLWMRTLAGEMVRSPDIAFEIPETGRSGWVVSAFCPNTNARGEVIGVIEVVHDVTQRRADQDALRYRIELEQLIYRISSQFVNLSSDEVDAGIEESLAAIGQFCHVDRSYVFLFEDEDRLLTNTHEWVAKGVSSEKENIQRTPVEQLTWVAKRMLAGEPLVLTSMADAPPEAALEVEEWSRQHIDSLVCVPVVHSGGQRGFVGLDSCSCAREWSEDIVTLIRIVGEIFMSALTRRRNYEELRESEQRLLHAHKMEAVGRLAGGVAHDFNNLLTAISGYSELLTSSLPEEGVEHAQVTQIRLAAQRASELTQQLLAFSRRQMVGSKVVSLRHIIHEMRALLGRLIGEHIELVYELPQESCWVKSDPARLEQVLLNLVVNARDAMPQGGAIKVTLCHCTLSKLEAERARLNAPGDYIQWTVVDTGEGMEPETLTHLFEPFFTTKEQGKGTGLGLATVYGIVDQSGGVINVSSELKKGSSFEIYLPAVAPPNAVEEPVIARPRPKNGRGTVLLAEDEQPVRELISVVLSRYGYAIIEASNGEEALAIFKKSPEDVDLVLTDMVMPRMGGGELAESIEKICPGTRIMFMSGYTADTLPVLARMGEEIPFLQKPFSPDALVHMVQGCLANSSGEHTTS